MAKSDYKKAKDAAWAAFSKYIRLRDAVLTTGSTDYCKCFTCGTVHHIKEMDAGHWIPRNRLATFMHEQNVHGQCHSCNRFRGGKPQEYAVHLESLYGEGILQDLTRAASASIKVKAHEWRELEAEYKERCRVIEENEIVPKEWGDAFMARTMEVVR